MLQVDFESLLEFSGILVDLPQPGSSVKPPTVTTATSNVMASLRRDAAPGGPITQSGVSLKLIPSMGWLTRTCEPGVLRL